MSDFERERDESLLAMETARQRLLEQVRRLGADELALRRRGGWSVQEALRHVAESEVAYAKVVAFLRSAPPPETGETSDRDMASAEAAAAVLERTRRALLEALDGTDEAAFYDLRTLGREQYSVLSVIENASMHDDEHREQIAKIVSGS